MQQPSSGPEPQPRLIENALLFANEAVTLLRGDPLEKELKLALIHLCNAVELILKERLRHEHWAFVFDKIENARKDRYASGSFISANFEPCIDRLEHLCSVRLEDRDKKKWMALRSFRNQLTHFGVMADVYHCKDVAANSLDVFLRFVEEHLGMFISSHKTEVELLKSAAMEFQHFVQIRWEAAQNLIKQLPTDVKVLQCPACFRSAFLLDDSNKCAFCSYSDTVPAVFRKFVDTFWMNDDDEILEYDLGIRDVRDCPACKEDMLAEGTFRIGDKEFSFLCFNCASGYDFRFDPL